MLVTNAFVWYYFVIEMLNTAVQAAKINQSTALVIWILHFTAIGFSAIIGASFVKRIKDKSRFIFYWMFSGLILSMISIVLNLTVVQNILVLSLLFGVAFGFGMPSCMGYFADNIAVEKRGRIGGIIFLLSSLIIVGLGIVAGRMLALKQLFLQDGDCLD